MKYRIQRASRIALSNTLQEFAGKLVREISKDSNGDLSLQCCSPRDREKHHNICPNLRQPVVIKLTGCDWRLFNKGKIEESSAELFEGNKQKFLQKLVGQKIKSVYVNEEMWDVRLVFDNRLRLDIFCITTSNSRPTNNYQIRSSMCQIRLDYDGPKLLGEKMPI